MISPRFKTLLVAGTFDGLHCGHQYFLHTAKLLCNRLIVIIARDETVRQRKGHAPHRNELDRKARIEAELLGNVVVRLGRTDADFHATIREVSPDAILLGYDQRFDEVVAQRLFPNIQFLRSLPYHPERFKSSKFRK